MTAATASIATTSRTQVLPLPRHAHRRGTRGLGAFAETGVRRYPRPMAETRTLYDRAGGAPFFESLVARFYEGVAMDPVLRAVYPEADLGPARHRLTLFLIQYWGGPRTYDDERGHPRLRMRHAPFAIGPRERDRWLTQMRAAIEDLAPPTDVADELERYIAMAAEAMRNRD